MCLQVVAVLSGAFNGIIGTRVLQINGRIEAPISLLESRPHDATIAACLLRLSIGNEKKAFSYLY